ncbi:secretion system protein [Candidatus Saccharibacteria bacterium RIFCSPHIGHO2_12_FULL_41_12]|nr:MAG: secretion system protein [Candidatus Saccharibacteria bacterium RIFCSPHIGHO2_12_FULL_41_12]
MESYKFTGTKEGKKISGKVEAQTKEDAITTLSRQNVHVLNIKASSTIDRFSKLSLGKGKVKLKDLVVFTRQLSTMISAGVPLNRSLATMQTQSDNKYFTSVIGAISKDIEGGMPLADAFAKHPDVFSDVYVNMVRAGESGGILDEILQRLATQVEKDATIRKKIKSAMAYPVVILSITVVAFFGIMIFVIPKLGKIIKDLGGPNAQLPIYTQVMLGLSDFMRHNAIIIGIVLFGGVYLFRRYIKTTKGKYKLHATLLRIPVVKNIIIKIAIARFARTFASLMSAGVGVLDALEVTGGAIGNLVIEKDLKEAAEQIKAGKQLSEPLSKSPYFPAIVSQMLAIGEETGQIDTILLKVADFYEEEVDAVIDGISSLIEPVMIIVLGAMVGVIAASVMGPIASLSQNAGKE